MKRSRILSTLLSLSTAAVCMTGISITASAESSLFDCEVWVDTYDKNVTVSLDGDNVPEDAYTLIFFTYTPTEDGESLERAGTEFPTAEGTYIATVTAKDGSGYTDAGRSEPFTINGESYDLSDSIVYVTAESKKVTVRLDGGLVPPENYRVIFFSYASTETGESLERVGTDFPTAPGTYIAAIVANEDSGFTGENRSDPFTIEAGAETNPKTGSELPGLAAVMVSAAAIVIAAKKKLK